MAEADVLPGTTKKASKERYGRCRSAPVKCPASATASVTDSDQYSQGQKTDGTHPSLEALSKKLDPSFRRVAVVLGIYLGLGTLSFSLMSHQIKGNKTRKVLDAAYLSIVTMTTVGYGDLVPNSVLTKLVACAYVFLGMALVGLLLTKAADYLVGRQRVLLMKAMQSDSSKATTTLAITQDQETKKLKHKCITVLVLLKILIAVGISFLILVEKLNFVDAFYCVCCTISTLGYGDVSFKTTAGRIFAIFWIPAGTLCVAQFYVYMAELRTEKKRKSLVKCVLSRELTKHDLEAADFDGDGRVNESEFVIYKLKEMGKIAPEDIELCKKIFKCLDMDQSGTLNALDLNIAQVAQQRM